MCPGIHLSNIYAYYKVRGIYNYRCDSPPHPLFLSKTFRGLSSRRGVESSANTFVSRYNVADPGNVASGIGVPHVAELGAIWSLTKAAPNPGSDYNADIPLLLQKYWLSFILTFDPNLYRLPGSPRWEEWTANGQGAGTMSRLVFQHGVDASNIEKVQDPQRQRCESIIPWGVSIKQ